MFTEIGEVFTRVGAMFTEIGEVFTKIIKIVAGDLSSVKHSSQRFIKTVQEVFFNRYHFFHC